MNPTRALGCCLIGLASVLVAAEESPVGPTPGLALEAAAPKLREVFDQWELRGSQLRSGRFEWRLERLKRSRGFGSLPPHAMAQAATPNLSSFQPVELLRTAFVEDRFRLDGWSVPPVGMAWAEAFLSEFSVKDPLEDPQQYSIVVDPREEVHIWGQGGGEFFLGLRYNRGSESRIIDVGADGKASLPLDAGLIDAFGWAVRPAFGAGSAPRIERCRLLSVRPVIDGRSCLAIEEQLNSGPDAVSRRFWIDTERQGIVLRCTTYAANEVIRQQYSIDYDRSGEGTWLPVRMTILSINPFGDPHDVLYATRLSADLMNEIPNSTCDYALPQGKWVADRSGTREVFQTDHRRHRDAPLGKARISLAIDAGASRPLDVTVVRLVGKMIRWPGILVTIPALLASYAMGRAGVRLVSSGRRPCPGRGKE